MRVAILDDIHRAYEGTTGVRRLRDRAEVQIFIHPFGDPSVLRGFDALVANRERTRFTRSLLEQTDLRQHRTKLAITRTTSDLKLPSRGGCRIVVTQSHQGNLHEARSPNFAIGLMIAVMRQIPSIDRNSNSADGPAHDDLVLCGLKTSFMLVWGTSAGTLSRLPRHSR